MAKRYHQSKKDRMHERMGEERYLMKDRRGHHEGSEATRSKTSYTDYESQMDPRRRSEMMEQGFLNEDRNAIANMPQEVMTRPYEKIQGFLPDSIDDSAREIERRIHSTAKGSMSQFAPKKW